MRVARLRPLAAAAGVLGAAFALLTGAAGALAQAASAADGPAAVLPAAERFASTCLACHGEGGTSGFALTPSLAGQPSFYAITQLFLFREGRRSNEAMSAVAKGMSDADLRAFSELIAKLPAPAPSPADDVDSARMARGAAAAERFRCGSCHGSAFTGGQQVPRLAGQREDYLAKALAEFRGGTRIGYTSAMAEALVGVQDGEVGDLAYFLARAAR